MNIGMVGTGSIAHTMAKEFARPTTMPVVAVYSRNADTRAAMANEFHIPKVYTEYNEMLADPEVELIYIATPTACILSRPRLRCWPESTFSAKSPSSPPWHSWMNCSALRKSAICTCWRLLRPSTTRTMVWQSCLQRRSVTSRRYPAPSASIPAGTMPL